MESPTVSTGVEIILHAIDAPTHWLISSQANTRRFPNWKPLLGVVPARGRDFVNVHEDR